MDTLQINLTDKQKAFIAERLAEDGHGSASEYVLALLDEAQKKRAWEKAEKLVLEGAQSPKRPMTDEDWQQLHANVRQTPTADQP